MDKPKTTQMKYAVELMDVYTTTIYITAETEEDAVQTANNMQINWISKQPERRIGAVKSMLGDPIQNFKDGQSVKVLLGRIWVDGIFRRTIWEPGWAKAKHVVSINGMQYFVGKNDVKVSL